MVKTLLSASMTIYGISTKQKRGIMKKLGELKYCQNLFEFIQYQQMREWDQGIRGQWVQSRSLEDNIWDSDHNRKSRIHKIPFNKQVNLSNQPEVVILLQAAQIQRLNKLLSIHRNESKLYGKQHLDRHSYEIQIRELTSVVENLTKQNENLNRLNEQNKKQVKGSKVNEDIINVQGQQQYKKLANKYERALLEIGKMYDDNTKLQDELNSIYEQMEQSQRKRYSRQNQQQRELISKHLLEQMQVRHRQEITNLRKQLQNEMKGYRMLMSNRNEIEKQQLKEELEKERKQNGKLKKELQNFEKEKSTANQVRSEQQKNLRQLSTKLAQSQNKLLHWQRSKQSMRGTGQSYQKQKPKQQIIKLENQIAMLSQELERLTLLVEQKNQIVQRLKDKESKLYSNLSQNESKLKKIEQRFKIQKEKFQHIQIQYKQQLNSLKRKTKEVQDAHLLTKIELQQKIYQVREEERRQYEKRLENDRLLMQYQTSFDRNQVQRLKNNILILKKQIEEYESNQRRYLTEKSRDQYNARQAFREQQRKYELRISELERYINGMKIEIESEMKQQGKKDKQKFYEQINLQAQSYRQKQIQNTNKLRSLSKDHENRLRLIELQQNSKIQTLQSIINEKDRQISNLRNKIGYRQEDSIFSIKNQYENLNSKLDYISESLSKIKLNIESLQYDSSTTQFQSNYFQNSTRIDYVISQISSLAGQITQIGLNNQGNSPLISYYEEYIKQLQRQNETYLGLINEKIHSNQSVINKIWQRIDFNQQEQSQQWRKWFESMKRQQKLIEKVIQEKQQQTRNRIEQQKERAEKQYERLLAIEELQIKKNRLESDAKYWKGLYEKKQKDYEFLEGEFSKFSEKLLLKEKENRLSIDSLVERMQVQKSVFTQFRQQDKMELDKKDQTIAELNYQISSLSTKVASTKKQIEKAEQGMLKLLSEAKNDLANLEQMENQNVELRRKLKLASKQIQQTKMQYDTFINQIWRKINQLALSIERKGGKNQNGNAFIEPQLHGVQISLINLENAIKELKKEMFWVNHESYQDTIHKHVSKQFSVIKLTELNKQIERLSRENIELKEQIQRYKLQFASDTSKKNRIEQNLALMVILFAEIEELRSRVQNRQNIC